MMNVKREEKAAIFVQVKLKPSDIGLVPTADHNKDFDSRGSSPSSAPFSHFTP